MLYRRLGRSGLKLSTLSLGSWVTFDTQLNDDLALECMQTAWDAGCNWTTPEASRRRRERSDHGPRHREARMAALMVRDVH